MFGFYWQLQFRLYRYFGFGNRAKSSNQAGIHFFNVIVESCNTGV